MEFIDSDYKTIGFSLIACALIIFFGIGIFGITNSVPTYDNSTYINYNWTITINGEQYSNVILSEFTFPPMEKNSVITLEHDITDDYQIYRSIEIIVTNALFTAFRNEKTAENTLFSKNINGTGKGTILGTSTCHIPLEKIKPKDRLILSFITSENNAFINMVPPKIVTTSQYMTNIITKKWFVFMCVFFLIVFGITGTVIGISSKFLRKTVSTFIIISQVAFWGGLSLASQNNFLEILINSYTLNIFIKYISLSGFVLSLLAISYVHFTTSKKGKKFIQILILSIIATISITFIVQFVNNSAVILLKIIYALDTLLILLVCFIFSIRTIIKKDFKNSIIAFGVLSFYAFLFTDTILYAINKYMKGSFAKLDNSGFAIGVVLIVSCTIANYIYAISAEAYKNALEKHTKELSFLDYATGAFNRTKSIETLQQFEHDSTEYAVISITFDTNSFYDSVSDEQVSAAIKIIQRVFGCYGLVGRIDATKFVVIAAGMLQQKIVQLLFVFQELISIENKNSPTMLRLAAGYAFSNEFPDISYNQVYQIAEDRKTVLKTSEL